MLCARDRVARRTSLILYSARPIDATQAQQTLTVAFSGSFMSSEGVSDMGTTAHSDGGGPADVMMDDGAADNDGASMMLKVAIGVAVLMITSLFVYLRQNKKQHVAEEVNEIFQSTLRANDIGHIIATSHKELIEKGETGELDLDELGPSAWPDMPNVALAYIMEDLLAAGTEAVDAEDHEGAVLAFSEALTLEEGARPDGLELSDVVEPLQSVAFRLLLHRSGAYQALGDEQASARDAETAKTVYKMHMPDPEVEDPNAADQND